MDITILKGFSFTENETTYELVDIDASHCASEIGDVIFENKDDKRDFFESTANSVLRAMKGLAMKGFAITRNQLDVTDFKLPF